MRPVALAQLYWYFCLQRTLATCLMQSGLWQHQRRVPRTLLGTFQTLHPAMGNWEQPSQEAAPAPGAAVAGNLLLVPPKPPARKPLLPSLRTHQRSR